jgi:hypothetical protein
MTADEANIDAGRHEQRVGEIQERDGVPAEEAERRVEEEEPASR